MLTEGAGLRVSGQDSGRGTFAHRHAEWHDTTDGRRFIPLQNLSADQGKCGIWNSPLSETSVLAYEYGYSLEMPESLVIWEAQFGDFANGAQVIIDQTITSSEDSGTASLGSSFCSRTALKVRVPSTARRASSAS